MVRMKYKHTIQYILHILALVIGQPITVSHAYYVHILHIAKNSMPF